LHVLKKCNQWYDEQQPWKLANKDEHKQRLQTIKYIVVDTLRICGLSLYPIIPRKMDQLLQDWMGLNKQEDYVREKMRFGLQ
ncbi:hypothetical protein, partial [Vibrio parahaemolyticus]|uniref:hypothetical protein n=1 Tax=Vibrio parahaemolyticus TaxID=670 RepID=UPI001A902F71